MRITRHLYISGRVQGVGFRHFTRTKATETGVDGWVRNMDDGRVEVMIQGEREEVEKMIEKLSKGPAYSKVGRIEVEEPETEKLSGFKVVY